MRELLLGPFSTKNMGKRKRQETDNSTQEGPPGAHMVIVKRNRHSTDQGTTSTETESRIETAHYTTSHLNATLPTPTSIVAAYSTFTNKASESISTSVSVSETPAMTINTYYSYSEVSPSESPLPSAPPHHSLVDVTLLADRDTVPPGEYHDINILLNRLHYERIIRQQAMYVNALDHKNVQTEEDTIEQAPVRK